MAFLDKGSIIVRQLSDAIKVEDTRRKAFMQHFFFC